MCHSAACASAGRPRWQEHRWPGNAALAERVPPRLPPSARHVPGEVVFTGCLGSEVLKCFVFLLNLRFCVLTERCSKLLIFITLPFCTLLRINDILHSSLFFSLSVRGQILGSSSGSFEGPIDWWLGVKPPMESLLLSFLPWCWEADQSSSAVRQDTPILLLCYSPMSGNFNRFHHLSPGAGKEWGKMLARGSIALQLL